jgi:signal transduction histidine kinase
MRLAVRNTLFLVTAYAAVLLLLAGVVVFQLLMLQASVQKETARLFAREVAGALTEPSLDRLLQADPEARQNLKTLIEQLTRRSQVVSSISVVDRRGRVVASDNHPVGSHLPAPDRIFGENRMRFATIGAWPFSAGLYELSVPLVERGERVGYLQIRLQSNSVRDMNRRMWNELLTAALIGLACIVGLGFALHVELTTRGRNLARALEEAIAGGNPRVDPELDEFSAAIATAGRAGLELNRARSQSAEERERFVTLGKVLNVGVILLSAHGELEFASARARELFGCATQAELQGMLARWAPQIDEEAQRAKSANSEGVRLDILAPGAPAGLRLELFALDGQTSGRLVLVRDRATIQALETDLRLATQLRGLARLYLSMAHDIRAPLGAIVTHLELLGMSMDDEAAGETTVHERRRRYLRVLDEEIHRLRRSLDGLLNHAALPREATEEVDLREVVVDLEQLLGPQCRRQRVKLLTRLPEGQVRVRATRDALKQALINLSVNALEAMPEGGNLELSLDRIDSRAILSVADSGPGVPAEIRDKIFTMHFTTKGSGTGIGLYVARNVAESSGGKIRVDSEPGRGARFEIDLPALTGRG